MRRLGPLVVVLLVGFAPVPPYRPKAGELDLAQIQGTWVLDHAHKNGVREEVTQKAVWVIKGDCLTTTLDGKPGSTNYLKLNARTTPGSLDLRSARDAATAVPGRYRVDGDTLTVSMGAERPADLSGMGPCSGVWVMRRVKP